MNKRKSAKAKPKTSLWYIGLWATIWWAVSGIYLVVLAWMIKNRYENSLANENILKVLKKTYTTSTILQLVLGLVLIVWVLGAIIWLMELKRQKITYRSAFKDLFLTIRK
jgi:uncharacterized membrane protein HdeD (DUF308 family)